MTDVSAALIQIRHLFSLIHFRRVLRRALQGYYKKKSTINQIKGVPPFRPVIKSITPSAHLVKLHTRLIRKKKKDCRHHRL